MSNLDQNYTRIANSILEATMKAKFSGSQRKIIDAIWRYTYGFQRKSHDLSNSFIAEATGIDERSVKKELKLLIDCKVIVVLKQPTNKDPRILGFNKRTEQWTLTEGRVVGVSKKTPQQQLSWGDVLDTSGGEQIDTSGGDILDTQEKKYLKERFKENIYTFEKFFSIYPRRVSKSKAETSWNNLSKKPDFDPERIIMNTMNFAETCQLLETKPNFIPHPATYLNQKRFSDYPIVDPEGLAESNKSKLDKNLDFLRQELMGGAEVEQGRSPIAPSESGRSLPEPN